MKPKDSQDSTTKSYPESVVSSPRTHTLLKINF